MHRGPVFNFNENRIGFILLVERSRLRGLPRFVFSMLPGLRMIPFTPLLTGLFLTGNISKYNSIPFVYYL